MALTLLRTRGLSLSLLIVFATVVACSYNSGQGNQTSASPDDQMNAVPVMDTLVSTEWLALHKHDPDLVILDANVIVQFDGAGGYQSVTGQPNYNKAHIPNAVFADLIEQLSDPARPGQLSMPTADYFASQISKLGVGDNTRVVIYDHSNSAWAARVWWMLRWVGFDNAALLDGGLVAWQAENRPVSSEPNMGTPRKLTMALRPELIADQHEVRTAIGKSNVNIIDALPAAHYTGQFSLYGKPGHIPGASNVPASTLSDDSGRFLPQDQLSKLFVTPDSERTITYCGGGISAAADAFILHRLGYNDVALYAGSLSDWVENPDNPMVVSEEKGP